MVTYESSRDFFNQVVKQYKEYVILYKFLNHGSIEGRTGFADFYWSMSYIHRNTSLVMESARR